MILFLFFLTIMTVSVLTVLTNKRLGSKAMGLNIAILFTFIIAPISSFMAFKGYSYSLTTESLIISLISLSIPIIIFVLFVPERRGEILESKIKLNGSVMAILIFGLLISLFGSLKIYQAVFSAFSISNLNDLNVAMSSDRLPSFGIYGRMNRLSIIFGMLSFSAALLSKNSRDKKIFSFFAILFTLLLFGVRRATLINQIVMYLIIYISIMSSHKSIFRNLVFLASLMLGATYFFGAIQVATNKSGSNNPLVSGLRDGFVYISGNLPYAECIQEGGFEYDRRNSFPFIYTLLQGGAETSIEKPFCDIGEGQLFNTSPIYFDIIKDKGYAFLIAFMFVLGIVLSMIYFGYIPIIGVQAIITGVVIFGIRENQIGQYDTIFSLILYPFFAAILIRAYYQGGSR